MTDTATATATATTTEIDNEDVKKGKEKEAPLVHDQGFFSHDTGDVYDGFFEAKKKDRSVKMHGPGVYTTAEGDCYKGNWEFDKFGGPDEVVISYTDGSRYEGTFKDWCYNSHGRYHYPDGSVLKCEFADNCPVGHMKLIDPNGHLWLGKADHGYGWFEPVNHYYEFLETSRESNKFRRRHKNAQDSIDATTVSFTEKQKSETFDGDG